jgi:hypothetical protein
VGRWGCWILAHDEKTRHIYKVAHLCTRSCARRKREEREERERDMVYAYNLPNLGYGYDQYYSSSSSSSSPHHGGYDTFQHHHQHLFAQLGSSSSGSGSGSSGQHHNHNHNHSAGSNGGGSMDDPFSKVDVSSHIIAALNSTGKTLPYDVNHDTMFENPDSQCFVKPISEAGVGAMASTFSFLAICLFVSPQSR